METFTFYAQRHYAVYEECPYSVNADNIEEARKIFIKALEEGEEDKYSNGHWYLKEDVISEELDYYDEKFELIW